MPPRPLLRPPPEAPRRGVAGRRVAAALVVLAIAAAGMVIWRGSEISQWITTRTSHGTTQPAAESRTGNPTAAVPAIPSTGQTPGGSATTAAISPTTSVAPQPGSPSVLRQSALPAGIEIAGCPNDRATVHATVLADATVKAVNLGWRPPGAAVQQVPMTRSGDGYSATLGPFTAPGVVVWAIEVIDSHGLAGYGPIANLQVEAC